MADTTRSELVRVMVTNFIQDFEDRHGPVNVQQISLEGLTDAKVSHLERGA
jgi:hypothetical protein